MFRFSLRALLILAPCVALAIAYLLRPPPGIKQLQEAGVKLVHHDLIRFDSIGNVSIGWAPSSGIESPKDVAGAFFPPDRAVTSRMSRSLCQFPQLHVVSFDGCKIEHDAIAHLAECRSVRLVIISASNANDDDLCMLAAIPSLEVVDVLDSNVTQEGIWAFCAKRPDVVVANWYP